MTAGERHDRGWPRLTPEAAAQLVTGWVRRYTRELPEEVRARRVGELDADLHDHITAARAAGTTEPRIALGILSRMARGIPADLSWRGEHAARHGRDPDKPGGPSLTTSNAYRLALALALGTFLFLAWSVAAMGLVGAEGDPFDLLYLGLVGVGILAAALVRFEPGAMVRVLLGMAGAQAVLTVVALALGKQESPVSSVAEIVGLNAMFIVLYGGAAWLFARAARGRASRSRDAAFDAGG